MWLSGNRIFLIWDIPVQVLWRARPDGNIDTEHRLSLPSERIGQHLFEIIKLDDICIVHKVPTAKVVARSPVRRTAKKRHLPDRNKKCFIQFTDGMLLMK
jgi:hypothetical protein